MSICEFARGHVISVNPDSFTYLSFLFVWLPIYDFWTFLVYDVVLGRVMMDQGVMVEYDEWG